MLRQQPHLASYVRLKAAPVREAFPSRPACAILASRAWMVARATVVKVLLLPVVSEGACPYIDCSIVCRHHAGGWYKETVGSAGCQICPAGSYAGGAASTCTQCPASSPVSREGSISLVDCEAPELSVRISLEMTMRKSEFSEAKKEMLKQGIADAAGVQVSRVRIVSVEADGGLRRQLQDAIMLEIEIFAADSQAAAALAQTLTADTINAETSKMGLPPVKMVRQPEVAMFNTSTTGAVEKPAPGQESGEDRVTIVRGNQRTHNNSSCNFRHLNTNFSLILNTDSTVANVAGLMVVGHCVLAVWVITLVLCCCCISMCGCCCVRRWYRNRNKSNLLVDDNAAISSCAGLHSNHESTSPSRDPDVDITPQCHVPLSPPVIESLPVDDQAVEHIRDAANTSDIQVKVVASGYSFDLDNPSSLVDDFDLLSSPFTSEDHAQQVSELPCET